jgi:two-component system sensor histidine kinase VicK
MVADNGIGIPRSEQKRIFNPFYQLKQSSIETDLGMGMGLAVVKDLVELHNGRVWVESMVGQGSMFYVALPLTQD